METLKTVLSKIFPTPSYIALPSVGVDISDTSLKYICFAPGRNHTKKTALKYWGDIDIPANSLKSGEVINVKQLVGSLKEFKQRTSSEFIRVSLPEERAYIFETEIKNNVPRREIESLLEFRLEENVPIPVRDTIFDYDFMTSPDKPNTTLIVVAAYQRDTIMEYYEACRAAELIPISFEVEAQAMARAVIPQTNYNDTVMLVDFGKTRTGIGISKNEVLLYTSTIDIGGGQLSQMLRRILGDNMSEAELTNIKNNQGLIHGLNDNKISDAIMPTISVIKDEIVNRMQYWHRKDSSRDNNRRITSIILCGGSANLKGLPEYLTEAIGITCIRGNVWEKAFPRYNDVPPIERNYSYGYATAIGLALGTTL